jgi:hypothetical protein
MVLARVGVLAHFHSLFHSLFQVLDSLLRQLLVVGLQRLEEALMLEVLEVLVVERGWFPQH